MLKTKAVLCFLLIFFVFCFASCGKKSQSIVLHELKSAGNISQTVKNKSVYTQNKSHKDLRKISRSDMAVLYFDEENFSVSLYDYAQKKLWNSLPDTYTDGAPSVVSVDVIYKNEVYTFNSQTDSVIKNEAVCEIKDDSIMLTYNFEGTAKDGKVLSFRLPVFFAVTDGAMTASIDCGKMDVSSLPSEAFIKTIHLLDYLGSSSSGENGDYILIPDGSGAVIDTSEKADKFKKISVPVYSSSFSSSEENKSGAVIGAFGVKQGESGFVCLIENGEAQSTVICEKALADASYNRVGASFDLVKTEKTDKGVYISQEPYKGEIKLTYKLVSSDRANYTGMASAIRETLIRNGTLGMADSLEESSSLPFVLTVTGSAEIKEAKKKTTVLTTFRHAQDVVDLFRSKGISNIAIRYKGMFEGGVGGNGLASLKVNSSLGSKKDLKAFSEYTDLQNIKVYPSLNLISAKEGKMKNKALSLSGEKSTVISQDLKNKVVISEGVRNLVSLNDIENNTTALLSLARELPFGAVSIDDAGKYVYADYSDSSYAHRQEVKNSIFSQFSALSSLGNLMVEKGNIYTVKYADYIVNLPMTSSVDGRDYCKSVPFVQSILHGIVNYTTTPMNLAKNTETALLKAAEYGAVPHFEVYYEDFSTEESQDTYHYTYCAFLAQTDYERLSNTFRTLQNEKITNHYLVKDGVYCTEYSSDISVYVNYNKKDVKVNGVTVEGRSFLKVG